MRRLYFYFVVLSIAALWSPSHLWAQGNAQNGATTGGVAGAIIGGVIGHQNDKTTEGVLIGGAVGAIAGGLTGRAEDERLVREQYYRQQMARQQQLAQARAVSMGDVMNMTRNGVGDSVIINQIQTNGVDRQIDVHDIIALHQQGVSENVINAMQTAPLAPQLQPAPPTAFLAPSAIVAPPTVIFQRTYVPAPIVHPAHHFPYPHYHWR